MNEPLKGKKWSILDTDGSHMVCDIEDIESAVEWLKANLYGFDDKDLKYFRICNQIDKAFEDVTKK